MAKKHHKKVETISKFSLVIFFLTVFCLYLIPAQDFWRSLTLKKLAPSVRNSEINFEISKYPINSKNIPPPGISASAAAIIDLNSMVPVYQKNLYQTQKPASLTKMMTALVALDHYKLSDVLEVKSLLLEKNESKMGLALGDKVSVETLLYGLMLPSGNDAAWVLANSLPGGKEEFIAAMNKKSQELHLKNTHFTNPSGKDEPQQFTCVYDLAVIAKEIIKNPIMTKIIATSYLQIDRYKLQNVNQLLGIYWGTYGVKTGFTDEAGQCLITAVKRNDKNYLSVVLNSPDRFYESEVILDWAFSNFSISNISDQ